MIAFCRITRVRNITHPRNFGTLFIYYSSRKFQLLESIEWMVSDFFFTCVTIKLTCVTWKPPIEAHAGELWVFTSLHKAGAREFWTDQSGFSKREKLYCPDVDVSLQEKHWNQDTFLATAGINFLWKGIYNSSNHIKLQTLKNVKHFLSPSF